jgi:hypothetical protein
MAVRKLSQHSKWSIFHKCVAIIILLFKVLRSNYLYGLYYTHSTIPDNCGFLGEGTFTKHIHAFVEMMTRFQEVYQR